MIYYRYKNSPFDVSGDEFIIIINTIDNWEDMINDYNYWIYDLSGVDRLKDYKTLSCTSHYKNKPHYLIK